MLHRPRFGPALLKFLAIVAVLAAGVSPSFGAAETTRVFDIPAGPATETLRRAAEQAGTEIVFAAATVQDITTAAVKGTYTPRMALATMLAPTRLVAVIDARTGAFTVRPAGDRSPSPERTVPASPPPRAAPTADDPVSLDRFVVTGSQIARTDYETVQPVTILSSRDIETGAVGTPLELMNRLPFLGALSAYENQDGGRTRGSASSINLRGLGGQNTLILLNGRRLPYYSLPLGSLVFYNINNLPLAAVQRVEVLRDGASAIYGADATAGVVNFITRGEADERRVSVRYGDTTDGAAPEIRGSLVHTQTFKAGRSRLMVVLDAYHRDALMAADRSFAVLGDKRGLVPEPFGSLAAWNQLTNIGPLGSFTLVAETGKPKVLPGLTTNTAYVDASGVLQPGTRSPAAYYNDAGFFSVMPERTSRDVFVSFDHRLASGLEFFAEGSANQVKSTAWQSPMTIASTQNRDANDQVMIIPASNYYNPFGTRFYGPGTTHPTIAPRAVQFTFLDEAFGPRIGHIDTTQNRWLAGLRGHAHDWSWEVAELYTTNTARDTTLNMISRSALIASLAQSTSDAFNMFGGPGANPEAVLTPLRTTSYLGGRSSLSLTDAKLAGPLWPLPAGPLMLAAGAEYREEKLRSEHSANYVANDVLNVAGQDNFRSDRDVRSAYVEFQVPLAQDASRIWLSRAEAQLAGRWENFSGFGSQAKPKVGVALTILPSLFLRASIGRGFRAPTLTQLYGSEGRSMAARTDSFRPQDGNVRRLIRQPAVPTLQPEHSESRTVGVVFEPRWLPGFSLGVDGWRYRIDDQINVVDRDTQLALEVAGGAYSNPNVIRVAPTTAEPIGAILAIVEPWKNFARAETDGFDFSMSYHLGRTEKGRLTLGVDATYIRDYRVQEGPGDPMVSFPTDENRPRFRSVSRLEFERRAWRVQVLQRYTGGYRPADPVVVGTESYRIPSSVVWDLSLTRQFTAFAFLRDATVTLGLNNVLDRDPPLYPVRQGYDATLASPQGRFAYLNVSFRY